LKKTAVFCETYYSALNVPNSQKKFIFSASSEVQATIEPVPSSSTSQKRQFDDTDVLNDDVLSKRTKLENVTLQEEVEIAVESQADEEITGNHRGYLVVVTWIGLSSINL
jgi:hypothetical protein